MAQYLTGTVAVTNGSPIVTGTGTAWDDEIAPGNIFTIQGSNVWYEVASVADDDTVTLSADYQGATASGQSYTITRDFTGNFGIPVPQRGDIETASLLRRALTRVDQVIQSLTNSDLNLTSFLGLDDVPASYAGHGRKLVRVVVGENGLEFVDPGGTFGVWRGAWVSSTDGYEEFDIVSHNGSGWIAITDTFAEPGSTDNEWDLVASKGDDGGPGPQGIQGLPGIIGAWRGAWSAGAYVLNDVVSHNGSAWIATIATTAEPGSTDNEWDVVAAGGDDGEDGADGSDGAGYAATSATSLAIGTGANVFTTQANLAYSAGARVRATSAADTSNWMEGLVTSYAGTTLTVAVDLVHGSGTHADWNINLAGEPGETVVVAEDVDYDNATSGLAAENVQAALDETNQRIDDIPDPVAMAIVFGS